MGDDRFKFQTIRQDSNEWNSNEDQFHPDQYNSNDWTGREEGKPLLDPYATITEKSVRKGFITKVLGIVTVQLCITTIMCGLFMVYDNIQEFVMGPSGLPLYIVSLVIMFGTIIMLMCNQSLGRRVPYNYLILCLFTLAVSYTVALVTIQYTVKSVLFTCGITLAVCIVLITYAMCTKTDFTSMGGALASLLTILLIMGFIQIFVRNETLNIIYGGLGAFVFSMYLIYDIQLICGGEHRKYKLSPDEYIFAAIAIYLDIINLFLDLLMLFGKRRD